MKYTDLGSTHLNVSQLCFGGLTISPLQAYLAPEAGAELIAYGVEKGINFLDTAELYGLYPTLKQAFRLVKRGQLTLSTKAYCHDRETAIYSVESALEAMETDYIDLFMLHEQESEHTLRGHEQAINQLLRYKEQGMIKAIGLSTHFIAGVQGGANHPLIDVIHPIYNALGLGIVDGKASEMLTAIENAHALGKGIFAMKILAGGHLIHGAKHEIQKAIELGCFHSIAIGMKSRAEIDANVSLFNEKPLEDAFFKSLQTDRRLLIHDWCIGCGACVKKCPQNALEIIEGMAHVRHSNCVLCGYCAAVCPEFCIKVV